MIKKREKKSEWYKLTSIDESNLEISEGVNSIGVLGKKTLVDGFCSEEATAPIIYY